MSRVRVSSPALPPLFRIPRLSAKKWGRGHLLICRLTAMSDDAQAVVARWWLLSGFPMAFQLVEEPGQNPRCGFCAAAGLGEVADHSYKTSCRIPYQGIVYVSSHATHHTRQEETTSPHPKDSRAAKWAGKSSGRRAGLRRRASHVGGLSRGDELAHGRNPRWSCPIARAPADSGARSGLGPSGGRTC